jgi:hypothetical protein
VILLPAGSNRKMGKAVDTGTMMGIIQGRGSSGISVCEIPSFPTQSQVISHQSSDPVHHPLRAVWLFLVLLASLIVAPLARAQDFTFFVSNGEATITSYIGTSPTLNIPTVISSFPVRAVADYAFQYNSTITSVVIPNGVTTIGEGAFQGCSGLTTMSFPNSIASMGNDACRDCSALATVTIGTGLASLGSNVFAGCSLLSSITVAVANSFYSSEGGVLFDEARTQLIHYPARKSGPYVVPATVTGIASFAFQGAVNAFTSVTLPAGLTSIGAYAFSGCTLLTSITIPNSVVLVDLLAFGECTGITSIHIGSGATDIRTRAFSGCSNLVAITVDPLNPSYSSVDGVFFDKFQTRLIQYPAKKAGRYVVPTGVVVLEPYAFDFATSLTSLSLPTSVTTIGDSCFSRCSALTSIVIPESVTRILEYTFEDCARLTSVTVGNAVTEIGSFAFSGCIRLTGATFGTGLASIGENAFSGCGLLVRARFFGSAPSIGTSAFSPVGAGFTVTYSAGASGFTSPTWNGFASVASSTSPPEIAVEQPATNTLTSGVSEVVFAPVLVNTTTVNTFTIRNSGADVLRDIVATQDGPHAAEFTVSAVPALLNGGASTTFTVTCRPAAQGLRKAVLHLSSNDFDENPFVIHLSGFGNGPAIAVEQLPANTPLADAASTVAFGEVPLVTPQGITFTIRNPGTASLASLLITKSGTHNAEFTVGPLGATTVAPGGSTTFTVSFSPTAIGLRTAAISIASNVVGSMNPFTFNLTGVGIAPEIAAELENGTNLVDNAAAVSHGSTLVGTQILRSYLIRNTGGANLTGLAITKAGTHMNDFVVTLSPVAPVAPGNFTMLTVAFNPSATGVRTAVIQIANNDTDENPFDINLSGTGTAPDISVEQVTVLADAVSTVAYGSSNIGTGVARVFTVRNPGSANLFNLALTIDGTHAADFTVTAAPVSPVLPAGFTTFSVTFNPSASGARTATLRIASNVTGTKNPFDIALSGTGLFPEISVEQPATVLLTDDVSISNFTSTVVNATTVNTFTIRNLGTSALTGISITKDGAHAADFTVSAVAASVAVGVSTTFTVTFRPSAVGLRTAAIRIASNDLNENPFDVQLAGTGIIPDIAVELMPNNAPLVDGVSTVPFDIVPINTTKILSFTIRNSGSSSLTSLAITKTGTNNAEFTVGVLGATTLAPGATTTFTISFRPTVVGARTAAIAIASNVTGAKNPFNINLNGGLSSQAGLAALALSQGTLTPAFSTTIDQYSASVDSTISSLSVIPTVLQAGAVVRVNGATVASGISSSPIPLVLGANPISVVVTAPDGVTTRTYSVEVGKNDPYGSWALSEMLTTANSGRLDDPDQDGIPNLHEYAFGTGPLVGAPGPLALNGGAISRRGTPWVESSGAAVNQAVFIRRADYLAAGLVYTPQFSSDMILWTDSAEIPTVRADDGLVQAVSVPFPADRPFFRVAVRLP